MSVTFLTNEAINVCRRLCGELFSQLVVFRHFLRNKPFWVLIQLVPDLFFLFKLFKDFASTKTYYFIFWSFVHFISFCFVLNLFLFCLFFFHAQNTSSNSIPLVFFLLLLLFFKFCHSFSYNDLVSQFRIELLCFLLFCCDFLILPSCFYIWIDILNHIWYMLWYDRWYDVLIDLMLN